MPQDEAFGGPVRSLKGPYLLLRVHTFNIAGIVAGPDCYRCRLPIETTHLIIIIHYPDCSVTPLF